MLISDSIFDSIESLGKQLESDESSEIDFDLYDDGFVETIDQNYQLHGKNFDEIQRQEQELVQMLEEQDQVFKNEDHKETIDYLEKLHQALDESGNQDEIERISIELLENDIHETIEDSNRIVEITADSIESLEKKEEEFINDLRKEDEFFQTDEHSEQIQLLQFINENLEILDHYKIEIGKDGSDFFETFDNGITKTRLRGENLADLKQKEGEFFQDLKEKKTRMEARKKASNSFQEKMETAQSFEENGRNSGENSIEYEWSSYLKMLNDVKEDEEIEEKLTTIRPQKVNIEEMEDEIKSWLERRFRAPRKSYQEIKTL